MISVIHHVSLIQQNKHTHLHMHAHTLCVFRLKPCGEFLNPMFLQQREKSHARSRTRSPRLRLWNKRALPRTSELKIERSVTWYNLQPTARARGDLSRDLYAPPIRSALLFFSFRFELLYIYTRNDDYYVLNIEKESEVK